MDNLRTFIRNKALSDKNYRYFIYNKSIVISFSFTC